MAPVRFNLIVGIIRNYHLLEYLQLFSLSQVARYFTPSNRLGNQRVTEFYNAAVPINVMRPYKTSWHNTSILYTWAQITFVALEVTTSYMYKPRFLYLWLETGV